MFSIAFACTHTTNVPDPKRRSFDEEFEPFHVNRDIPRTVPHYLVCILEYNTAIASMTTKATKTPQTREGQDDDEFDQFSDPVDDVWVPTVDYRINHVLLVPQPTVDNCSNPTTRRFSPSESSAENKSRKPRVPPDTVAVRKKEQRRAYHEKNKSNNLGGLTHCCSICGQLYRN